MASLPLLAAPVDWHLLGLGMVRWAHIISGITWIGLLYFFNLVNVPVQGKLDAPTKKAVNPQLQPRALWWFRWGAMSTLIFGLILFYWKYIADRAMYQPAPDGSGGEVMSEKSMWIMWGMLFGLIMWFNVWFVIWPAQKVIIKCTIEGTKPPEHLPPRAKLFSRTNFMLSGPMLVCMIMPTAYGAFSWMAFGVTAVVSLVLVHLAVRASDKVGATI